MARHCLTQVNHFDAGVLLGIETEVGVGPLLVGAYVGNAYARPVAFAVFDADTQRVVRLLVNNGN